MTSIYIKTTGTTMIRVFADTAADAKALEAAGFRFLGNDRRPLDAAYAAGIRVEPMMCSAYYFGRIG